MKKRNNPAGMDAAIVNIRLKKMLLKKTYTHSMNVAKTAEMLAVHFGADRVRAKIAGLLHDCAKDMDESRLKYAVKKYNVKLKKTEKNIPAIWHGFIAEKIAKNEFGIIDRQVLRAIRIHSTGSRQMGIIEKIVYVSDFIEPGRKYRKSAEIRGLLKRNISLDCLVAYVVKEKIGYLLRKKQMIHPETKRLAGILKRNRMTAGII